MALEDEEILKARALSRRIRELFEGTMGVQSRLPPNQLALHKQDVYEVLDRIKSDAAAATSTRAQLLAHTAAAAVQPDAGSHSHDGDPESAERSASPSSRSPGSPSSSATPASPVHVMMTPWAAVSPQQQQQQGGVSTSMAFDPSATLPQHLQRWQQDTSDTAASTSEARDSLTTASQPPLRLQKQDASSPAANRRYQVLQRRMSAQARQRSERVNEDYETFSIWDPATNTMLRQARPIKFRLHVDEAQRRHEQFELEAERVQSTAKAEIEAAAAAVAAAAAAAAARAAAQPVAKVRTRPGSAPPTATCTSSLRNGTFTAHARLSTGHFSQLVGQICAEGGHGPPSPSSSPSTPLDGTASRPTSARLPLAVSWRQPQEGEQSPAAVPPAVPPVGDEVSARLHDTLTVTKSGAFLSTQRPASAPTPPPVRPSSSRPASATVSVGGGSVFLSPRSRPPPMWRPSSGVSRPFSATRSTSSSRPSSAGVTSRLHFPTASFLSQTVAGAEAAASHKASPRAYDYGAHDAHTTAGGTAGGTSGRTAGGTSAATAWGVEAVSVEETKRRLGVKHVLVPTATMRTMCSNYQQLFTLSGGT